MSTIFKRRSIRRYTAQPVTPAQLEMVLKAGMAAPSAENQQPWQFVVVDHREKLDRIPEFHPYSRMLKEAGVAIIVCGDRTLEKIAGFWVQDCAAAAENMLLMAEELGLGSVWLAVYLLPDRVKALRELLGLPDHITPLAILPIGYPAEAKEPIDRFDAWRVHRNHW
ncbi:nitroreductase [Hydrogenispora ethanolica]|uniref:Nitroreductase n=1 Tax=Hydrogenispora ethanolica TaxID=1082276 RepID=A0A4R1S772_HYDET|nr:nitroreductase family protein [Hydrogenispora ethanolica]TCL75168.1 nitroreductase [Hydrogenispora ethanolica]